MIKGLWFNMEHIFSKSLRIANVSKLGLYLILYLKENTWETAKTIKTSIPYNEDYINRECFNTNANGRQAERALTNLRDKKIILYNADERTIKLNYDVRTWRVTPEQHEQIMEIYQSQNDVIGESE